PTVANTITASAKPTLTTATKATSSVLTGWTTSCAVGDILEINVDSVSTVTKVYLDIFVNGPADSPGSTGPTGPGGVPTLTEFTQDLGVSDASGTFDITGLSGLTIDKKVMMMQTPGAISSKGNARDEPE